MVLLYKIAEQTDFRFQAPRLFRHLFMQEKKAEHVAHFADGIQYEELMSDLGCARICQVSVILGDIS